MDKDSRLDALIDRRRALGLGLLTVAMLAPLPGRAAVRPHAERSLSFFHLHTGERLEAVYWADGRYRPETLTEIDRLCRDFRTGEAIPIEVGLLDLLHDLRRTMESSAPFEIFSAYRSPKTNAMLASRSDGVAKKSLHMRGMAVDVRLPGRDLRKLRSAAIALRRGGVGYYPSSDFVHLDVGRVRRW